jgi:hypothetical protein
LVCGNGDTTGRSVCDTPDSARYSERQKEREFFDILKCGSGEFHPEALRAAETAANHMHSTLPPDRNKSPEVLRGGFGSVI